VLVDVEFNVRLYLLVLLVRPTATNCKYDIGTRYQALPRIAPIISSSYEISITYRDRGGRPETTIILMLEVSRAVSNHPIRSRHMKGSTNSTSFHDCHHEKEVETVGGGVENGMHFSPHFRRTDLYA
jgi:hypothetical protein